MEPRSLQVSYNFEIINFKFSFINNMLKQKKYYSPFAFHPSPLGAMLILSLFFIIVFIINCGSFTIYKYEFKNIMIKISWFDQLYIYPQHEREYFHFFKNTKNKIEISKYYN